MSTLRILVQKVINGGGVAKDPQQARAWFAKAAAQGDPDAISALINQPSK
jgi:TPR repeat protein